MKRQSQLPSHKSPVKNLTPDDKAGLEARKGLQPPSPQTGGVMIPALHQDYESDFQAGGESDTDFSNKWNRNACTGLH